MELPWVGTLQARNSIKAQLNSFALESDFEVFPSLDRLILQTVLWPLVLLGVAGNVAVLWRVALLPVGRLYLLKPFYRCGLLSFAVSDLTLLIASGSYTLTKLNSRASLLWWLPSWTCSAVPYFQTVAVLAGSLTLAAIAVDRYRALRPNNSAAKESKWFQAICFNVLIWLFAMAASYPIIGIYESNKLIIIRDDFTTYEGCLCSTEQSYTGLVYAALFVVIFAPLALIFLAVHVLLALNIWRRQLGRSNKSHCATANDSQNTEFSTVSNGRKQVKPSAPRPISSNYIRRKKRTVHVILVLILVFLVGRLPSWAFLLYKQHAFLNGSVWHYVQILLTALTFLNAALDPFLYAFLCETLSLLAFLRSCCSAKNRTSDVTLRDNDIAVLPSVNAVIVPRGPYNM